MTDVAASQQIAARLQRFFQAEMLDPHGLHKDELTDESDDPVEHLALNQLCVSWNNEGKPPALQFVHHTKDGGDILRAAFVH